MKRVVKAENTLSSKVWDWFAGNEAEELMKRCHPKEKRLIAKIRQSTDPEVYVVGIADAIDLFGVATTAEFDRILEVLLSDGVTI